MKVGFLAGTLGRGGAERQLLYMLQALLNEGIESRVLCLTKGEAFEQEIRALGIEVVWVGRSQSRLMRLGSIIRNLRKNPVDILQSAHFFTNMYSAMSGRILGIRSVGAIRGNLRQAMVSNGKLGRLHLNLPHHLIANSKSAMTEAVQNAIDIRNIDFVRNVVAFDNAIKTEKVSDRESLSILFAGRLVPVKRPELFLELASNLRSEMPDFKLNFQVAGDGPLRNQLEHLADKLSLLPSNITFLGEKSEMNEVYRESDILVLTSEHEGTPNVILEAMSRGIPVVATRVGGVPEVLTDRCGLLVNPDDFENLVKSIETLIRNKDLRLEMGANGKEQVRKNHSISYLQERLTNIYSKVLNCRITND